MVDISGTTTSPWNHTLFFTLTSDRREGYTMTGEDQHRRRHGEATVVIIGGGISGICVAIDLLKKNNCRDFVILEKSAGVGGTWYV